MAILTLLDYLLLTGLIAGIWVSFNRGFVVEGIDLVKWVIAIYVVTEYWPVLQEMMAPYIDNPDIRLLAGVVALIVGTVIAGEAAKYLFDQFVKWPQVRLADKILGGMFGFAKWSIIGYGARSCCRSNLVERVAHGRKASAGGKYDHRPFPSGLTRKV